MLIVQWTRSSAKPSRLTQIRLLPLAADPLPWLMIVGRLKNAQDKRFRFRRRRKLPLPRVNRPRCYNQFKDHQSGHSPAAAEGRDLPNRPRQVSRVPCPPMSDVTAQPLIENFTHSTSSAHLIITARPRRSRRHASGHRSRPHAVQATGRHRHRRAQLRRRRPQCRIA
jgi:hypothetical protein